MGMMIVAFPVSLVISILKGYRVSVSTYNPISLAFVIFGLFLMIVGFSLFGVLMFIFVENTKTDEGPLPIIHNSSLPESKYNKISDSKDQSNRNTIMIKQWSNLKKPNDSWEKYVSEESSDHEFNEHFEFNEKTITPRKKTFKKTKSTMISLITEDDRVILRKLRILFSLSVIMGLLALIFFSLLSSRINNSSPKSDLILLWSVFFIEIFSCFLIYIVFTTQIKVKDKVLLKFFTIISLEMNKKIPKIKYPKNFKFIGLRLHNFYS